MNSRREIEGERDEISLVEIYHALCKEKLLIVLSTLVCLGIGTGYLVTAEPMYESNAIIQIGRVACPDYYVGACLIEDGLELGHRLSLNWKNIKAAPVGRGRRKSKIFIRITGSGATPESAYVRTKKAVHDLLLEEQKDFESTTSVWRSQLAQYKEALAEAKKSLEGMSTPSALVVSPFVRSEVYLQMANLAAKIGEIQLKLQPGRSYPARLIQMPRMPSKPSRPKKGMILGMSLLVGVLLGMVLAVGRFSYSSGSDAKRTNQVRG